MKSIIWKKYKSDEKDGFPPNLEVEICESMGEEVEFEKGYSGFYFLTEDDEESVLQKPLRQPPNLNKSRKWVEERIYEDCKKEVWEARDIFRILAWKTGKINHNECPKEEGENTQIIYYSGWEEGPDRKRFVSFQIPYQRQVTWKKFEPVTNEIIDIRKKYLKNKKAKTAQTAKTAWESLLNLANNDDYKEIMKGIGSVYLITLLHFITNGEYPIYDRFAMASLAVWKLKSLESLEGNNVKITDQTIVRGCSLPSKNSEEAKSLLDKGIYADYKRLLNEFCEEEYKNKDVWKTNRDVDRALWVFGHFFDAYQ